MYATTLGCRGFRFDSLMQQAVRALAAACGGFVIADDADGLVSRLSVARLDPSPADTTEDDGAEQSEHPECDPYQAGFMHRPPPPSACRRRRIGIVCGDCTERCPKEHVQHQQSCGHWKQDEPQAGDNHQHNPANDRKKVPSPEEPEHDVFLTLSLHLNPLPYQVSTELHRRICAVIIQLLWIYSRVFKRALMGSFV
jgi:hypothetical protein